MKRYAIKQGSFISTTQVCPFGQKGRNQEVLTIFPSKKQALAWKKTWRNSNELKLIKVNVFIIGE